MSEQTNNSINKIRAEKISQMELLPDDLRKSNDTNEITEIDLEDLNLNSNWDKLYFVLALNDGDKRRYANYKLNFSQLIGMLVDSGQISGIDNQHEILLTNQINYTLDPPQTIFSGSTYTFRIIPDTGYELPTSIILLKAEYSYDPLTGRVYITKIHRNVKPEIDIQVIPTEYEFTKTFIGINAVINPNLYRYTIENEITIDLTTIDQNNYDLPNISDIEYEGLRIISYTLQTSSKGCLKVKLTGNELPRLTMQAVRSYYYRFGYTTNTENILTFNDDTIIGVGRDFINLTTTRSTCPISYEEGFVYGSGEEYYAYNNNVYIIVPKRYVIVSGTSMLFIDDNGNSYIMLARTSLFEMSIQKYVSGPKRNQPIIHELTYDNVDYYILCISCEGKYGRQLFLSRGNVINKKIDIEWINTLPNELYASDTYDLTNELGYINVIYGDGHRESVNDINFIVSFGTLNNRSLVLPAVNNICTMTIICKYETFTKTKDITIKVKDTDFGLYGIIWNQEISSSITAGTTITLNKNTIYGQYTNEEPRLVSNPNNVEFSAEHGEINNNVYTAPNVSEDLQEILYARYTINDVTYTISKNINITPIVEPQPEDPTPVDPDPTPVDPDPQPEDPTPQLSEYGYFYIGTELPTAPYNPETNLATEESNWLGWRKITAAHNTYNSSNPLYDDDTLISDSINAKRYYVILPQGFICKDRGTGQANVFDSVYGTLSIGDITYNIYDGRDTAFNAIIYYDL